MSRRKRLHGRRHPKRSLVWQTHTGDAPPARTLPRDSLIVSIPAELVLLMLPSIIYVLVQRERKGTWRGILERIGWRDCSPVFVAWARGFAVVLGGLGVLAVQAVPSTVLHGRNVSASYYAEKPSTRHSGKRSFSAVCWVAGWCGALAFRSGTPCRPLPFSCLTCCCWWSASRSGRSLWCRDLPAGYWDGCAIAPTASCRAGLHIASSTRWVPWCRCADRYLRQTEVADRSSNWGDCAVTAQPRSSSLA